MTQPGNPTHEGAVTTTLGPSGYRVEIEASGHTLVSDEPLEVGGSNAGATPYDLVLAALGACTAMTLRMYADRKQWPLEGVAVHMHHSRSHAVDEQHCRTSSHRCGSNSPFPIGLARPAAVVAERLPSHDARSIRPIPTMPPGKNTMTSINQSP